LWGGEREVWTLDPDTWTMGEYPNPEGPAPTVTRSRGVYGKWQYFPELDVFIGYNNVDEGVWLYRLPAEPPKPQLTVAEKPPERRSAGAKERKVRKRPANGPLRVCPSDRFMEGCHYRLLSDALKQAAPGDTIVLAPGTYEQAAKVKVDNITIRGEPGAHLRGKAFDGKAALVINGDNVVVDGIECSEIHVPDKNGACIRIQAPNLTVRNVYFHDNQEGILGGEEGGRVIIENSVFERNGAGGRAHGVYVSSGVDDLVFRGNKILSTMGSGHGLKSRAARSMIENNVIAGLEGNDSRAIDLPMGGEAVIRNNVLQKGPNSKNADMIFVANPRKAIHDVNSTLIENNTMIFDGPIGKSGAVLNGGSPAPIVIRNNVIIGDARLAKPVELTLIDEGNRFLPNRRTAGLGPFPSLP
jgi:hypothetical protein